MENKQCGTCGEWKPATPEYFPPRKEGKDGLRGQCRICHNIRCNASEILKARRNGILPRTKKGKMLSCAGCGKEFYRQPRHIRDGDNYCSRKCFGAAFSKSQAGENHPSYKRVEIACAQCGEMLSRTPYQIKKLTNHFCSEKCRGQWQAKNLAGSNSPTYTKIETACKQCGETIHVVASATGKYGNFCGRKCYRVWRRGGIDPQAERASDYKHRVAQNHHRRALKLGVPSTLTEADIERQHNAQKAKCYYCGVKVGEIYHVDHVVPLIRGGTNCPENIVIACPSCNMAKHDKLPHEWPQGGRLL